MDVLKTWVVLHTKILSIIPIPLHGEKKEKKEKKKSFELEQIYDNLVV